MEIFNHQNLETMEETEFNLFIQLILIITQNYTTWNKLEEDGLEINFNQMIALLDTKANIFFQNEEMEKVQSMVMVIDTLREKFGL